LPLEFSHSLGRKRTVNTRDSVRPGAGLRPIDWGVLIGSAVVVYPLMWRGRILNRWEGAILLGGYVAYVASTLF